VHTGIRRAKIAGTSARFLASHVDSKDIEGRGLVVSIPRRGRDTSTWKLTLGGEDIASHTRGRGIFAGGRPARMALRDG